MVQLQGSWLYIKGLFHPKHKTKTLSSTGVWQTDTFGSVLFLQNSENYSYICNYGEIQPE